MKYLIAILFSLKVCFSFAQLDSLYTVVANETCECIEKKDLANESANSIKTALGLCMLESISTKDIEFDVSNQNEMRKFGEKIGVHMAPICPSVFEHFLDEEEEESSSDEVFSISGKITAVEEGDFIFITLKDQSGKKNRLGWLRYFPGSDDFVDEPANLKGLKVQIEYRLIECYLPKAKGYYTIKELVSLELDN